MKSKTKQDAPKTIGELRQRLVKLGSPWQVDPRLSDDERLPDRPRGGQREEDIPEEHRLMPLEPGADLRGLIATQPPANPFLRARWAENGMLQRDDVEGMAPEPDEDEGGAA
jgi:hypothetical protein